MEDLKKIIGTFIKRDVKEIHNGTVIDNTAIPGSIMIHRMYAIINKAGFNIKNYTGINSYGDLLNRLNRPDVQTISGSTNAIIDTNPNNEPAQATTTAIGIDIEHIDNLPKAVDLREDIFYKSNFTNKEISYALLKPKTYETLAGLFCAKEALCKTNNAIKLTPFNQIEIEHTAAGVPVFRDYALSISHANGFSIAVAVRQPVAVAAATPVHEPVMEKQFTYTAAPALQTGINTATQKSSFLLFALVVSVAISILLLFIIIKKAFYPNFPHYIFNRGKIPMPARDRVSLYWIIGALHLLLF